MVIERVTMPTVIHSNVKNGQGDISFINLVDKNIMTNCRLMTEMSIPVNGYIGEHTHINETEYYIIQEGSALVLDNGQERAAKSGDVIITGHNESHSIQNKGDIPLKIIAIIITH
jgi:mannose-6-phosphate isomerase-like protein (cupin superfamily)